MAHSDSRVDLSRIKLADSGDVSSPDKDEAKTIAELAAIASKHRLMVSLGGDNSITYSAATAVAANHPWTHSAPMAQGSPFQPPWQVLGIGTLRPPSCDGGPQSAPPAAARAHPEAG